MKAPKEAGYYIVWEDELMTKPVGLIKVVVGPRGGVRKPRWVDPVLHAHAVWIDDWYWTKLQTNQKTLNY